MPQQLNFTEVGNYETVGECAERLYPGQTYDTALPQGWVDDLHERGFDPRGHFVTLYEKEGPCYMAPLTPEGVRMAAILASGILAPPVAPRSPLEDPAVIEICRRAADLEVQVFNQGRELNGVWHSHPFFPLEDWQRECAEGETLLSYYNWVIQQIHNRYDDPAPFDTSGG